MTRDDDCRHHHHYRSGRDRDRDRRSQHYHRHDRHQHYNSHQRSSSSGHRNETRHHPQNNDGGQHSSFYQHQPAPFEYLPHMQNISDLPPMHLISQPNCDLNFNTNPPMHPVNYQQNAAPFQGNFVPMGPASTLFQPPPPLSHQQLPIEQQGWPETVQMSAASNITNEQALSASALDMLQLPKDKITETGIIPDRPYYELPAGLMVPLVPANRREYEPLEPSELRLPFPKFPDENFLKTMDSFYETDKKTRDNDGWDREFIDLYRKQKEILSQQTQ